MPYICNRNNKKTFPVNYQIYNIKITNTSLIVCYNLQSAGTRTTLKEATRSVYHFRSQIGLIHCYVS